MKKLGKRNAKKVIQALSKIAFFNVTSEELSELTPSSTCENRFFCDLNDYYVSILITNTVEVTVYALGHVYTEMVP